MKTLLVTIATAEIFKHAEGFLNNQFKYAKARGYEYRIKEVLEWPHLHASFSKVFEINRALTEGYDYVIWADADVAFMNRQVDLVDILKPSYWMTGYKQGNWKTWDYICDGLLVFKNGPEALKYCEQWIDRCLNGCPLTVPGQRTMIRDHPWEQWHSDGLNREWNFKGIHPASAKEIGCFCPEIWHDGVKWTKELPTVHMAGPATWERRAEVFETIYRKQVIK